MQIEHVAVSGFKAISSLSFDPGQVTVVTGRNNSGKTSLLEAVELALDPTVLSQYGERVDELVSATAETATVEVTYRTDSAGTSDESDSEATQKRELSLSVCDASGGRESFVSLVSSNVRSQHHVVDRVASLLGAYGRSALTGDEAATVARIVREEIVDSIERVVEETHAESITSKRLSVTVDGSTYEYGYIEGYPAELGETIAADAAGPTADRLTEAAETDLGFESTADLDPPVVRDTLYGAVTSSLRGGWFRGGTPPTLDSYTFREDDLTLSATDVDLGEDDAAVRLSDIEDYLRERDLVEHLDTLSLDQMVYEEDGEKYQVSYEFTGEGFKTLLGLLWELWESPDDVVLLEEPENHMHPRYIHEFVRWLVEVAADTETQVVLTTHDIDTIRSFFDFVEESQTEFLDAEFCLLKMDQTVPEVYDYADAAELSREMQVDLRGI